MGIRFLATNLWDSATLSALSEASGFEVERIQSRAALDHWRSTGLSSEWVKADLGSAQSIKAIAVRYSNLRVGDTLYFQGNATDSWGGPSVNQSITITAAMVASGTIAYNWTSGQSYRYWRILMTSSGNPDGYIRIGKIYLGSYLEPTSSYDKDFDDFWGDPADVLASPSGQKFVNLRPQRRQIGLVFSSISAADYAIFEALSLALGRSYAFFVELDSDDLSRTWYVSAPNGWPIHHIYGGQHYSMVLALEEEG